MAKYIDADLLRKEIERHRQAIRVLNEHTAPEQMSKTCAIFQYSDSILSELLSLLDTVSEEPDKGLEEEIETWIPAHISVRTDETLPLNPTELANACKEWGKGIARHFAEWGAEHLKK